VNAARTSLRRILEISYSSSFSRFLSALQQTLYTSFSSQPLDLTCLLRHTELCYPKGKAPCRLSSMKITSFRLASRAVLVLALAQDGIAFWRMPCRSRSGLARMDPLVSPGEASGHVHAIHGSSGMLSTLQPLNQPSSALLSEFQYPLQS
jgi:Domain of unknown function (DUF1996)